MRRQDWLESGVSAGCCLHHGSGESDVSDVVCTKDQVSIDVSSLSALLIERLATNKKHCSLFPGAVCTGLDVDVECQLELLSSFFTF